MIFPVFEVPGLQHVTDKPEEPLVLDFLRQYPEKDLMVKRPEAVRDISFNKPYGPGPGIVDLPQCGMASAPFPEPVRQVRETWFVVCLKKQAHHFADEFIGP
jgi:hypothetical protein